MLRMATAMVMQMRRNVGFMFRESGQAMERLGMSMMGDYSYMEPRECYCLPPNDAVHCLLAHLGVGNAAATPFFAVGWAFLAAAQCSHTVQWWGEGGWGRGRGRLGSLGRAGGTGTGDAALVPSEPECHTCPRAEALSVHAARLGGRRRSELALEG